MHSRHDTIRPTSREFRNSGVFWYLRHSKWASDKAVISDNYYGGSERSMGCFRKSTWNGLRLSFKMVAVAIVSDGNRWPLTWGAFTKQISALLTANKNGVIRLMPQTLPALMWIINGPPPADIMNIYPAKNDPLTPAIYSGVGGNDGGHRNFRFGLWRPLRRDVQNSAHTTQMLEAITVTGDGASKWVLNYSQWTRLISKSQPLNCLNVSRCKKLLISNKWFITVNWMTSKHK